MRKLISLVIILIVPCACADSLLLNGSFESLEGDAPANWKVFVLPKEGAQGQVDSAVARDGARSVTLRNPATYETDPCNNWSQNVKDVAGKTLVLGGYIKTREAGGAALWLQCWRNDPWGVVQVASTSDETSLAGTHDWTPVAVKVDVPDETEFATVRCVLTGSGAAWFDDLRLVPAEPSSTLDKTIETLSGRSRKAKSATAGEGEAKKRLMGEAGDLAELVQSLRESNVALLKDLAQLREEIKALREQVPRPATPPSASVAGKPAGRVPPLIPHGFDLKEWRPDAR